jgi:hypothetical protein
MELVLRWDSRTHVDKEWADVFRFKVREVQDSKKVQVWLSDHIREVLEEQFDDDGWAVMQVALGKAKQHLSSPDALGERVNNVVVQNEMDPLDGEPLSTVDLYCTHLIGRDRCARCQMAREEFADNPARCVPGKNACWRQVYLKD